MVCHLQYFYFLWIYQTSIYFSTMESYFLHQSQEKFGLVHWIFWSMAMVLMVTQIIVSCLTMGAFLVAIKFSSFRLILPFCFLSCYWKGKGVPSSLYSVGSCHFLSCSCLLLRTCVWKISSWAFRLLFSLYYQYSNQFSLMIREWKREVSGRTVGKLSYRG